MATLTIENLHKSYGEARVVDDVAFEVADGEFIVLVGPSGCGKSTTLRMVAGLEGIDGGTIDIGERRVNNLHPADRDVAMVFQSYALYPHLNVYQNIAYGLKRRQVSRRDIDARVKRVAATLKLEDLLQRRPSQLSGGQRQRVALGRAIVREPAVFLMDEPLSNLDAKLRVEMRAELTRLHAALGATIIYVTHDQVEAMTMGDRIVVMNAGRIEQTGTPLEVYSSPASLFVATFLGLPEINLIRGAVTADGRFVGGGIALDLPGVSPVRREVIVGLRPQDLMALPLGHDQREGLGTARVTAVEHHGPESFATVLLGETPLTLQIAPLGGIQVGMSVGVHLDTLAPHFFDPDTGLRICLPPQLEE